MAGERLLFLTDQFENPVINKEKSFSSAGISENKLSIGEIVDFDNDSFAWLRLSKTSGDQINWANAIYYDFKRGIQFFYDHNFITEGLSYLFGEDPYRPYQAAISFGSIAVDKEGRIVSKVKYGAFYYDRDGILRTIRVEQITQESFQHNVPSVNFRQREDGLWSVYPVRDLQEPMSYYSRVGKPVQPVTAIRVDGREVEFSEMVYGLHGKDGRMKVVQRSLTWHRKKVIEVPLTIDIPRWKYLLGLQDGEWVKAFSEFPSSLEIIK